ELARARLGRHHLRRRRFRLGPPRRAAGPPGETLRQRPRLIERDLCSPPRPHPAGERRPPFDWPRVAARGVQRALERLPVGLLFLLLLFLAADAQGGDRASVQPLWRDRFIAPLADAEGSVLDPLQRLL